MRGITALRRGRFDGAILNLFEGTFDSFRLVHDKALVLLDWGGRELFRLIGYSLLSHECVRVIEEVLGGGRILLPH